MLSTEFYDKYLLYFLRHNQDMLTIAIIAFDGLRIFQTKIAAKIIRVQGMTNLTVKNMHRNSGENHVCVQFQ